MSLSRSHFQVLFCKGHDVELARDAIPQLVDQFNRTMGKSEHLHLDLVSIDDATPTLGVHQAITTFIEHADIVVFVFWRSLCATSPPGPDSLLRQFHFAVQRHARTGSPRILLYRCMRDVPIDALFSAEGIENARLFQAFLAENHNYAPFKDERDLEHRLFSHLSTAASELSGRDTAGSSQSVDFQPYLRYLDRVCSHITVPGIGGPELKVIPLVRVYVRLRMLAPEGEKTPRDVFYLQDALPNPLLALVGDPGAGKTTILQYISLRLARYHLHGDADAPTMLGFDNHVPIPIRFDVSKLLSDLAEAGIEPQSDMASSQWGTLLERTLARGELVLPSGTGEKLLNSGGLLLLFDGLDEISGAAARMSLAMAVVDLASKYAGPQHRPNRAIITCRTRAWPGGEHLTSFREARLLPLDANAIHEFVARWCGAVCNVSDGSSPPSAVNQAARLAEGLRTAIFRSHPVRIIATNPQMLTMLAVIYHARRGLPQQRARLYGECVDCLLQKRAEQLDPWGGEPVIKRYLRTIARAMQESSVPADSLTRQAVTELLASELGDATNLARAAELLHDLEVHVGLLVACGDGVRFVHRTFQEYLVAFDMADHPMPAERLATYLDDANWAEIIALTAGILADRGETLLSRFIEALVDMKDAPLNMRAQRAGLAASCLADLRVWSIRKQVLQPLVDALHGVLDIVENPLREVSIETRIAVADGLGRTHDPRLEEDRRWIDVPEGLFWRGSEPESGGLEDEGPSGEVHISAFKIGRWQVTVGEFARFVNDGGYADDAFWSPASLEWRAEHRLRHPDQWDQQIEGPRNHPVIGVSFWEAQAYCRWLDTLQRPTLPNDRIVRLPSEAEWEKAARGGYETRQGNSKQWRYPWGDGWRALHANSAEHEDAVGNTTPVGLWRAGDGPYGCWDQAGNVFEWCEDWYHPEAYATLPHDNPVLLSVNNASPRQATDALGQLVMVPCRVARGGGWVSYKSNLRVSARTAFPPGRAFRFLGFRCVIGRLLR